MLRNCLWYFSGFCIAAIAVLQVLGRFDRSPSTVTTPPASEPAVAESAVKADDAEFSFRHLVVPEQGRPVGRVRGGSSR